MTVLEAVVQQSGIYAPSRKGRLSVFWGDQVFLPSVDFKYTPTHHVDIMCTLLGDTAPTAEEWTAQGLEKYGVIAVLKGKDGGVAEAAQVEKVDHATATRMLGQLGTIGQVGPSLGSFSVSGTILKAMLEEYNAELIDKTAKLDTDPHFWCVCHFIWESIEIKKFGLMLSPRSSSSGCLSLSAKLTTFIS
jgi:hypothetical protein